MLRFDRKQQKSVKQLSFKKKKKKKKLYPSGSFGRGIKKNLERVCNKDAILFILIFFACNTGEKAIGI